jgi:hypothetical protein
MKRLSLTSITRSALVACALAIGVFASTLTAKAQSGTLIGIANVPFAFQVGSLEMPAGVYEIHRASTNVLTLKGKANRETVFMLVHATETRKAQDQGNLVFHRFGDTYFMGQIWEAGVNFGAECTKSQAEKEIARAENRPAAGLTQVAFNSTPRRR